MGKLAFVRSGLASASVVVTMHAIGCSDNASPTVVDAGVVSPDAATLADAASGAADSSMPVDAGAAGTGDILIDIVHAAPDVPAVGLCLAAVVSGSPQFIAPFDRVQGPLPRYAGTQIAIPAALQAASANAPVRVYLVPGYAPTDAGATSCASVVGTPSAVLLKEFSAGAFQAGKGYIVAATGCANPAAGTVTKCGADSVNPSAPRALGPWVKGFDRGAIGARDFGAQVVHLSPQLQGTSFRVPTADGGVAPAPLFAQGVKLALGTPVRSEQGLTYDWKVWASGGSPVKFGDDPTATITFGLGDAGNPNTFALGAFTASAATPTPPANGVVLYVPLQFAAVATVGPTSALVPSYFAAGVTYTFFAVGDPTQAPDPQAPDAGPDFIRFLAFPNNARVAIAGAGDASAN
jgi:hypothetical protein